MGRKAADIILSEEERLELEGLRRGHKTAQQLGLRARMILLASDGVKVGKTASRLGVWRKTVSTWRCRWLSSAGGTASVVERLSDAPRCGAPARITAEQICAIVALACERPAESDRPVTLWSQRELADEAMRRGIVEQISQRSVGRFLKRIGA